MEEKNQVSWGGDKGERNHRGKVNGPKVWRFAKLNGTLIKLISLKLAWL